MYSNELYHHGILGQKWGVKHGPPYPLDAKVSKGVQKKGKQDAKYRKQKEALKKGDKRVKTEGISHEFKREDRYIKDTGVWIHDDGSISTNTLANELSGMSYDEGMRVFGYKDYREGTTHRNEMFNNDAIIRNFARKVNDRRFGEEGYTNNCAKCSSAFILNMKGYDCMAGRSIHGNLNTASEYWWDGAVTHKEYSDNVQNRINKYGRNSCGTIGIRYKDGGGHAFNFVTDKTGHTRYINSQTGNILNSWDEVKSFFGGNIDESKHIRVCNLTNATPNFKHMAEDDVINYTDLQLRGDNRGRGVSRTSSMRDRAGHGDVEWWRI